MNTLLVPHHVASSGGGPLFLSQSLTFAESLCLSLIKGDHLQPSARLLKSLQTPLLILEAGKLAHTSNFLF
jgi:hypothetical protein